MTQLRLTEELPQSGGGTVIPGCVTLGWVPRDSTEAVWLQDARLATMGTGRQI